MTYKEQKDEINKVFSKYFSDFTIKKEDDFFHVYIVKNRCEFCVSYSKYEDNWNIQIFTDWFSGKYVAWSEKNSLEAALIEAMDQFKEKYENIISLYNEFFK